MGKAPGSELRLRGKWLYDLGFKPGMKVRVIERFSFLAGTKVLTLRPVLNSEFCILNSPLKTLSLRLLPRRDPQPKHLPLKPMTHK